MTLQNVKWILAREIRDQLRDRRTTFMIFVLPLLLYPLLGVSLTQMSQFMLQKPSRVLVVGAGEIIGPPALLENDHFAPELFGDAKTAQLLEVVFARESDGMDQADPQASKPWPTDMAERRARAREIIERDGLDAAAIFPADFALQLRLARQAIRDRARQRAYDEAHPDEAPSRRPPRGDSPAETPNAKIADDDLTPAVPAPEIIPNSSKAKSDLACELLRNVLRAWSDRIGDANLEASQVPVVAARPFVPLIERTVEDDERRSARFWAQMFPMFMVLWAMTGAFYPAVDLCAGEKERGTLETLLSSPATRGEIVLGKLVTIMLFSVATSLLNLASIAVTGLAVMQQLPRIGPPPVTAWIWLPIALLPVSALFSALCLALASFARSTKEGQYYLVPLILVVTPLVMAPLSPGIELTIGNALIPVMGLVLLLRSLLEGQYAQALPMIVPVVAVTLTCCVLALRWAVEQFNSETVLFRESERLDLGLWLRHLVRDREPTPRVAMAVACGVIILVVKFFLSLVGSAPGSFADLIRVAAISQVAMILAPTLLMTAFLVSSPRQTLRLYWPQWRVLPMVALLAFVFHPVAISLQNLVMQLYPIGEAMKEALGKLAMTDAPIWQLVAVMALMPAVCEELAFRGFILSGLRRSGHTGRAIVVSALFFGFAHGIIQQSLIACIVGLLIGYIAVKSNSILPGMVFHFIHNSLAAIVPKGIDWLRQTATTTETDDSLLGQILQQTPDGGLKYDIKLVAFGMVATALIVIWLSLLPHQRTPEEHRLQALRDTDGQFG